jgi:WD40 repeat protein
MTTLLLLLPLLLPVMYRPAGAGDCMLEFSAHKLGVNALARVTAAAGQQQQQQQQQSLLLSAGKDHAVRLWQISAGANMQQQQQQAGKGSKSSSSSSSSSTAAHCAVVYKGHKEAVQSVAVSPGADMCCSGGWDGQLLLWRTGWCNCMCYFLVV